MGIDAKMLIKVRRAECPSELELATWSFDICSSVGARFFWLSDGLPAGEPFQKAHKAWREAFDNHPRNAEWQAAQKTEGTSFVSVLEQDKSRPILNAIHADIGPYPTERRRAIDLTKDYSDDDEWHPGRDGRAYYQDGDTIYAEDGEWFLEVSLITRYYGIGYERGDLLSLCAMAEWIEKNIPNSEVWYGGDSSGCCAELFDKAKRDELKAHLYSQHGRDYFKDNGFLWGHESHAPQPPACSLCIPGEPRFNRYGWGSNYAAFSCAGCGKCFATRDGGASYQEEKDK